MLHPELKYQIALSLLKGIGNKLAKELIAYTGSAEAIFRERPKTLLKITGIGPKLSQEVGNNTVIPRAEKELEFIEKNNITAYFFTDKAYPFRLKECSDAPLLIFTKGRGALNDGKFIGIVGTRNASEAGKENCTHLISELALRHPDITVVSGLAYGIDVCAHRAALKADSPTWGILAHGLDRIYPASHRSVAVKMLEKGGLLTEYLTGTEAERPNFVQRNRIIAGLCDAVVVVESGVKGGSLITAQLANDYNRDVFAFPGRVTDEQSSGCNSLIKKNMASLIESAEDLARFMNWEEKGQRKSPVIEPTLFAELSEAENEVLNILRKYPDGIQVNELSIILHKSFSEMSSLLLQLEFAGFVKCLPGSIYQATR